MRSAVLFRWALGCVLICPNLRAIEIIWKWKEIAYHYCIFNI